MGIEDTTTNTQIWDIPIEKLVFLHSADWESYQKWQYLENQCANHSTTKIVKYIHRLHTKFQSNNLENQMNEVAADTASIVTGTARSDVKSCRLVLRPHFSSQTLHALLGPMGAESGGPGYELFWVTALEWIPISLVGSSSTVNSLHETK